jgi:hypothetical protein
MNRVSKYLITSLINISKIKMFLYLETMVYPCSPYFVTLYITLIAAIFGCMKQEIGIEQAAAFR